MFIFLVFIESPCSKFAPLKTLIYKVLQSIKLLTVEINFLHSHETLWDCVHVNQWRREKENQTQSELKPALKSPKVSILQIIISGMDHDAQTPIKLDIFKAQLIFYANVVASVAYFLKNRHFFRLIN